MSSWNLINLYFSTNPLHISSHHLKSYNYFVNNKIPIVIRSLNPITIIKKNPNVRIEVWVGDDSIQLKKKMSNDYNGEPKILFPNEARLKNLSYSADIHCDIQIKYFLNDAHSPQIITFKDYKIGTIPIMLHSCLCATLNQSKDVLKEMGECPYDQGGYFIVDGKEKVIVSQERNVTNKLFINKNNDTQIFKYSGFIRSTNLENSVFPKTVKFDVRGFKSSGHKQEEQRLLFEKNEYARENSILVTVPHIKISIPLFVLFRSLGIESDKEIIELILQEHVNNQEMLDFIRPSVVEGQYVYSQLQALDFLKQFTQYPSRENVQHILYDNLFPNIEYDFKQRSLFLGYISNKLVKTCLRMIPELDRDNYMYRRIGLSGYLLGDIFKDFYNLFRNKLRSRIDNIFEHQKKFDNNRIQGKEVFKLVNYKNVKDIFDTSIISKGMMKSMKGMWGTDPDPAKQGIVQDLNRKSYMDFISHLRRVNTPLKNNTKIVEPHRLSGSQWGIFCPCESPDGQNIGLLKNFAMLVHISNSTSPEEILDHTKRIFKIKLLRDCNSQDIRSQTCKILVNYSLVGILRNENSKCLFEFLKVIKRLGFIDVLTSISWNVFENEINVLTDEGRCCRPLIIANNEIKIQNTWDEMFKNYQVLNKSKLEDVDENNVHQFIKRHQKEINGLEYIDVEEANNSLIAMNSENANVNHTHYEIHPSTIFSVYTATIPFSNYNQSPRNVFSGAQGKQAIGVYSTTFNNRIDTMSYLLHYPQNPLVATKYNQFLNADKLPNGENLIVAIATYSGYNQEDAIIVNKSSIQRGMFNISYSKSHISEEESINDFQNDKKQIIFANPIASSNVADKVTIKQFANFNKIDEHGFPKLGSFFKEDDVIVGKCLIDNKIDNGKEIQEFTDKSEVIDKVLSGTVHNVYVDFKDDDTRFVKIKLNKVREPTLGDKFASRHGQKIVFA